MAKNNYKVPFHTAIRGFATAKFGGKGGLSAASIAAGKPENWLSQTLQSKGFMSKTVQALYVVFPELESAVRSGAVAQPPRIKRPGAGIRKTATVLPSQTAQTAYQRAVAKFGAERVESLLTTLAG